MAATLTFRPQVGEASRAVRAGVSGRRTGSSGRVAVDRLFSTAMSARSVTKWSSSIGPDADPAPHAALRTPRGGRGANGAVRRLGDAGPVRGRDSGAPGGSDGRRRLRRLAHGRDRGRRTDRPRPAAGDALERHRQAGTRRGPVHPADHGLGRDHRRPDRLPPRGSPLPARRQRVEPGRGLRVAEGAGAARLRRARRLGRVRVARRPGPARPRAARPARRQGVHLLARGAGRGRGDGQSHRLHRRGGRRARVHGRKTPFRSGTR